MRKRIVREQNDSYFDHLENVEFVVVSLLNVIKLELSFEEFFAEK